MDDILPELEEMFEVELSIAAIFGDSRTGARLGNSSIAVVVVPESDDPYGLFRIAEESRMVEVAEDVPTDQPEFGTVTVSVERTFGMLGDVEVREGGGEGRGREGRWFCLSMCRCVGETIQQLGLSTSIPIYYHYRSFS